MALTKWNQKLTPLDNEIQQLKSELISMWEMVLSQLQKAEESFITIQITILPFNPYI